MKEFILKHITITTLLFIIVVGLFLRFYNLGSNPPGMHADEADTGYTAYSLIKTGKDPYGNKWPLQFQGQANNFRAPLYTYSVIPSVMFFGLSPFSERLPSAIFGTLSIIAIFFLTKSLFKSEKIGLIAAFLFAINPWNILISRTGLEVGLSLFLTFLGVALFLYYSEKKDIKLIIISAFVFGLSFFSYHPAKIYVPLIIPVLLLYKYHFIKKRKKEFFIFLTIIGLFYVVMLNLAIFKNGAKEFDNVSIFDNTKAFENVNRDRHLTNASLGIASLFESKPIYYLQNIITGVVNPFSVNYLYLNGDSSLDKGLGKYGLYHIFELIFLLSGLYFLIKYKPKEVLLIAVLIFLSVIPGAITRTGYYTYRDIHLMPLIILIESFGAYHAFLYIKKNLSWWKYLLSIFVLLFFVFLSRFLYIYYFEYPVYSSPWWGSTQKEVFAYLKKNYQNDNRNIFVHGGSDWPVLYSFYSRIEPKKFQKSYQERTDKYIKIDNYIFGHIVDNENIFPARDLEKNSIFIIPGQYFKESMPVLVFRNQVSSSVETQLFITK